MLKTISTGCMFLALTGMMLNAQDKIETKEQRDARMAWWREAKFGMFIHWGVYSVPAGYYKGKPVNGIGEWIMNRGKIPCADYQAFALQFNPVKFNADDFVKTAKDAGMKYMVITSKHHDGFAMFDTEYSNWNIYRGTPFGRDPLKELSEACKRQGMRLGFYYSQAQDWNNGGSASGGKWDKEHQGNDMDAYVEKVAVPQVREILSHYGPVAVLWWDTPIDMNAERAKKLYDTVQSLQPQVILNNRLGGGYKGDTETPEQYIPATGYPGEDWETCMTMNNTWGFKKDDNNWKSTDILLRNLVDIVSKGGNYLLNVGPNSEGLIPEPSVERLAEVGKWMKINGDSIYGTTASPFQFLPWGRCTRKGNMLYLHVFDWPADGKLRVPMTGEIGSAHLLASPDSALKTSSEGGKLVIELPSQAPDKIDSVIALELKGEPAAQGSLTLDKPVTASSEDGADTAASAVDGNEKTHWSAAKGQATGWLEVDLGKEESVIASTITEPEKGRDQRGITYSVQYKEGDAWKDVATSKTSGRGDQKIFAPVKARRFRLNITAAKGQPGISEWSLFAE